MVDWGEEHAKKSIDHNRSRYMRRVLSYGRLLAIRAGDIRRALTKYQIVRVDPENSEGILVEIGIENAEAADLSSGGCCGGGGGGGCGCGK